MSQFAASVSLGEVISHFEEFEDPRSTNNRLHPRNALLTWDWKRDLFQQPAQCGSARFPPQYPFVSRCRCLDLPDYDVHNSGALLSFPTRLLGVAGVTLLIAAVLILVARPIAVLLCASMFRFSIRELVFLSWVGLKGAVPITLATFPMLAGLPEASLMFDTVFVVVLVSSLLQGWTLPAAARFLKLDATEQRSPSPPVTLEISSLRDIDEDIVDYYVKTDCGAIGRAIRNLGLPDGVVVAMIARDREIIMPKGSTKIESGDHVVVIQRPAVRARVDRIFSCRVDDVPQLDSQSSDS